MIWSQIRILHTEEIENIIANDRKDLQEANDQLILQSIQHWDVTSLGF